MKSFLKNNICLLFLIIFSITITILLIYINTSQEILGNSYRDVYFYLIEALRFSGISIGGYEYVNYLSPLIPFLTSILFRIGLINESSIFIVTGVFYIISIIGIYLLLNLRFNKILSTFGALLFGGLSITLFWTANGTIDIPSVGLSIFALYFMILGVQKNQKYFYLAFPIFVLAFFAKYTAGLIFIIMGSYFIFYLISNGTIIKNIRKYLKHGIIGAVLGMITSLPFLFYFLINKIPLGFINQAQEIASTTGLSKKIENQIFYYFTNLCNFIYNPNQILSYVIIIITLMGIIIALYGFIRYLKNNYYFSSLNKILYPLLIFDIIILLSLLMIIDKISFIYSEILFFVFLFIFSIILNKIIKISINDKNKNIDNNRNRNNYLNKTKKLNYDLLMVAWFFSYMIFFSSHLTKVDRYFVTLAPSFVFFVVYSLNLILEKISKIKFRKKKIKEKNLKIIKKGLPLVLIIIFTISSFSYLTIDKHSPLVKNEKEMVQWLITYDSHYDEKIIWANRGPAFTWYLKKEVKYVNWISKPEELNPKELSKKMLDDNATYYIGLKPAKEIPEYRKIKSIGELTLYEKI